MSSELPPNAPVVVGYEVGALLGEGASAKVWAATGPGGKPVALKVLRNVEDDIAHERMRREASVLADLEHPGVVRLHATGRTADGRPYLAMERLDGQTLRARLADGALDEGAAWSVVRAVADGLAAAHARGVLHRDLTSGNVLFDDQGRPRLSDFGLAKRASDPTLSRDGASTGTPAYMAPEQWWGASVDERTDVYGLGALLYEALTGVPPWHGEDAAALIHKVATDAPPPPSERGVTSTPDVEAFLMRCLSRRPRDRPPDVAAFLREGDAAFGRKRIDVAPWLGLGLVALAPVVVGYGDTRDPMAWIYESGWAGYGVLLCFVLGLVSTAVWSASRPIAPLLPLLSGALGFETGMQMVRLSVAGVDPERRFAAFHLGVAEASSSFFMGGALSAAMLTWVALREGAARERPDLRSSVGALVALGVGVIAWDLGALVTCGLAAALILAGAHRRPASAMAAVAAIVSLALMSWVRLASAASRLFDMDLDRSARALEITRLDQLDTAALGASLLALVVFVALARWRGARAWSRRRFGIGVVGASLTVAACGVPWLSMEASRRDLTTSLSTHFAIWSELDPPHGEGAGPARLGLTLQIGRQQVRLDGEAVMPTAALESDTGGIVLAQQLGPRLLLAERPQLVVAADRATRWGTVRSALVMAQDLGVRHLDVLMLPGEPLRLSPSAPAEAAIVLPEDLRALPIRIGGGRRFADDTSFADVVAQLARSEMISLVAQ